MTAVILSVEALTSAAVPVFADEKLVREALNEQGGASDKL